MGFLHSSHIAADCIAAISDPGDYAGPILGGPTGHESASGLIDSVIVGSAHGDELWRIINKTLQFRPGDSGIIRAIKYGMCSTL